MLTVEQKLAEAIAKVANLESALEAIHTTANKRTGAATPIELHELLSRISSDAYGALGGGN